MPAGMEAVILAGGAGVRLREVVRDLPETDGTRRRPPVSRIPHRSAVVHWDVRDIVLATGYKSKVVETHFGDGSSHGAKIRYSVEARPMGTGGALRDALRMVRGDHFLLLNGDSFLDADLAEFLRSFIAVTVASERSRSSSARTLPGTDGCPWANGDGSLSMREKGIAGPGLINGGVHVWSREISRRIGPGTVSLENDVVRAASPRCLREGRPRLLRRHRNSEDYDTACRDCGRLRPCTKG